VYQKLYEKKMLNMLVKYLSKVEQENVCLQLIEETFPKFIGKIINKESFEFEAADGEKQKT
jgi:hypothetical protein